jgi:hypothetical protein
MDLGGISIGPGPRTPFVASYVSSFGGARASPKTLTPREHQRLLHSRASGQLQGRFRPGSRKHGISGTPGKGPRMRLWLDMMARRQEVKDRRRKLRFQTVRDAAPEGPANSMSDSNCGRAGAPRDSRVGSDE